MGEYTKITWRGRTFDKRTVAMLEEVEKRLGYELTIFQGSYNAGGVSQSAGTHDGGGAVDCWGKSVADAELIVMVMRRVGFAAWIRYPWQGPWGYHIHAIDIGNKRLSLGAANQVTAYRNGRNGLANNEADYHSRPNPIPVFRYGRLPVVDFSNVWEQMFRTKNRRSIPGVKQMQRALRARVDSSVVVDGIAGPQTRRAWRKWRRQRAGKAIDVLRRLGRNRFTVKK